METSTHLQSLEAMVSCSICYAVLTEAFTLPCHHNLCPAHRQELVIEVDKHNSEGFRCPLCNTFAKSSDVGGNKLMKQMIAACTKVRGGNFECTQCKSKNGSWRCVDCKADLCDDCQQGHQNIPACRGHRTVRHGESDGATLPKVDAFVYCERHPSKELEFNCRTCNVIMCYKCNVLKHGGHEIEELETAIERIRPEVADDVSKLQQRSATYRQHSEKLSAHATRIQTNAEDIKTRIREEQSRLLAAMKAEADFKVAQVEKDAERRLNEINSDREKLNHAAASMDGLATWGKNVLNNTTGASLVLEVQQNLVPQLNDKLQAGVSLPDVDVTLMKFQPLKMHETEHNLLGKILTKENAAKK